MGLDPRRVDALSLAEMRVLTGQWNAMHAPTEGDAPAPPSDDDFLDMLEMVDG